ncbi:MAG: ABC transporter substrate-binding protein [Rhodospirillaceae bacterium]|nr:ABC transporter substrate-binding protein [Rhodospirillaceae bacterium]
MRQSRCGRGMKALLSAVVALWCTAALAGPGDVLKLGAQRFPPLFGNPYSPIAQPAALPLQAIFDSLTRVGPEGRVEPGLAVAWTQEAPNTWVFTLRDGIVFSNGEPFNAAAVIAALDYLRTDEGRRDSLASQDVKTSMASYRARDDLIVEIITTSPDPILPLHLSFLRIPAPRHWATLGRDKFQLAPVGTGPFKVESWSEARLELIAHPRSWRAPLLGRITMLEIADPTVRVQAFASRAVDIAMALGPEDEPAVAALGGRLLARASPSVNYLLFVTVKDSPLKDVRVRRALNYAADKGRILKAFLADAVAPVGQFSHPLAFGFDPSVPPYPYDPDRARKLLAEAGYAQGFAFTALLDPSAGGGITEWYQLLAQSFAEVGVSMAIRPAPATRMTEYVQTGNWPAEAFAFTFAGFDSLRGYRFRSCAAANPYHCDPGLTPLIAAAQAATDLGTRLIATRAALAYERENPPGVLLWPGVGFDAVAGHVRDYVVEQDHVRFDLVRLASPGE